MRELIYDPAQLEALCREYYVQRLSVFGSVLRGEDTPTSDLDLLVEFQPAHGVGFFGLARLEYALTDVFGKRVDLQTAGFLNPAFRPHVVSNARAIYSR